MPLGEESFKEREGKKGHSLKRRYFTVIGSCNLKMVADRHRNAALNTTSTVTSFLGCQH